MFRQDWLGHLGGEGERTSTNVAIPKPIGFDHSACALSVTESAAQIVCNLNPSRGCGSLPNFQRL